MPGSGGIPGDINTVCDRTWLRWPGDDNICTYMYEHPAQPDGQEAQAGPAGDGDGGGGGGGGGGVCFYGRTRRFYDSMIL